MNALIKQIEAIEDQTPLQRVVEIAGGQSALAIKCGVKQQTVFVWLKTNRVPAERVLQVEKVVLGAVTRHELRPDIYPTDSA